MPESPDNASVRFGSASGTAANSPPVSFYSSEAPDFAFLHSCSYLPFCNFGISSKPFPAFGQKKNEGDSGRNA